MAAQGAVLAVLGVVLLIRAVIDGGSDVGRAVTFDVLLLVFAAGGLAIGRALWRGARSARTPTVLWNLFVMLVGTSLFRGGAPELGVCAFILGLAALVTGLTAPLEDADVADPSS